MARDVTKEVALTASFVAAVAVVTKQLNLLSVKLSALARVSETVTLPIKGVTNTPLRMSSKAQAIVTFCECQCRCEPASGEAKGQGNWLNAKWLQEMLGIFRKDVVARQATRYWAEALQWVRAPLARAREAIVEPGRPIVLTLANAGIGDAMAGALAWMRDPVLRNCDAIVRAIRKMNSICVHELKASTGGVMLAMCEAVGPWANFSQTASNGPRHRFGFPGALWNSIAMKPATRWPTLGALSGIYAGLVKPSLRPTMVPLGATAAAVLAAPLLVTPASSEPMPVRTQYQPIKTADMVINSSPTITITTSDSQDIERRVLDALRKHREALFSQWCAELRRRQRTEL